MTRRERLERKAELRREWAEKRRARSTASFSRSKEILDPIPFGQPILVGHHSENGHRNALNKADNAMRAGCESSAMANLHEEKADGIERQLRTSIFSDDSDATEQLQAKIAKEEKARDLMKAANAIVRKKPKNGWTAEKGEKLKALGIPAEKVAELFTPDFCGRIGFPSYALTNLGANIRRMKERIADIDRQNARKQAAELAPEGVLVEGGEYVRVTFPEKPERETINALKAGGFTWGGGSWTGKREDLPACVREITGAPRRGSLRWWSLERGFKCLIRCCRVYCWKPGEPFARRMDVDNGRWMQHEDINANPWQLVRLTDNQRANFEGAARDCYCYQGVDRCDFCTSMRTPDGAPWSSGEDFED